MDGRRDARLGTDAQSLADARARSIRAAAIIGIAVMAAVDEIVFHQILAWHHFYDRATPAVGLLADGLLHAAELLALVGGFFLYADVRRRHQLVPSAAWAGFLLGAGGFQVFDGVVDHKLLRLHQIRYDTDNLLAYDLAWNGFGLLLVAAGLWLLRRSRGAAARP